jgi:hypothetical protein
MNNDYARDTTVPPLNRNLRFAKRVGLTAVIATTLAAISGAAWASPEECDDKRAECDAGCERSYRYCAYDEWEGIPGSGGCEGTRENNFTTCEQEYSVCADGCQEPNCGCEEARTSCREGVENQYRQCISDCETSRTFCILNCSAQWMECS